MLLITSTAFWDRAAYARFVKIKDGKVQWVTGSRNAGRINNGDITYTEPFAGEVDGVRFIILFYFIYNNSNNFL